LTRNYFAQLLQSPWPGFLQVMFNSKAELAARKVVPVFVATALFGIRVYH